MVQDRLSQVRLIGFFDQKSGRGCTIGFVIFNRKSGRGHIIRFIFLHQKSGRGYIVWFVFFQEKSGGGLAIKIVGLLAALVLLLLGMPDAAWAVKPSAPVSVECVTVSSAGRVYRAECNLLVVAQPSPESVRLGTLQGPVVVTDALSPGPQGIGKWIITFDFKEQKAVTIPFEISYMGGAKMNIGVVYDPFNSLSKKTDPMLGVVSKGKNGNTREFLSK